MTDSPKHLQPVLPQSDGDAGNGDAISLSLADLLPDDSGAIVLEDDIGDFRLRIITDEAVVDTGVVEAMVTQNGENVSGHAFFAFSNGTTLYASRELDLTIVNPEI